MTQQKYDNGASLFAICYKKYYLIRVKVVVYKPETGLYNVTFKNSDGNKDLYIDLPEDQLISASELTKPELGYSAQGKPDGWNEKQTGIYIFNASDGFHIGSINFDGKWKDFNTNAFYPDISHYLKVADFTGHDANDLGEDRRPTK